VARRAISTAIKCRNFADVYGGLEMILSVNKPFAILKWQLVIFLTVLPMSAQVDAGSTAPVIENERVEVWDITLSPGKPMLMQRHKAAVVTMFLVGGEIRSTKENGETIVSKRKFGDVVYDALGTEHTEEVVSESPARLIVAELKDHPEPLYVNKSGYPPAFPRPGSLKVFENDRVVIWNYTWTPNVPTPMHFHDKDVVVVYRYDGSLKSTTPDGKSLVNEYKSGSIRFNRGDRVHFEELVKGDQSAMIMEFK
jgi:quercetin dioxygenase-like cupin family protein